MIQVVVTLLPLILERTVGLSAHKVSIPLPHLLLIESFQGILLLPWLHNLSHVEVFHQVLTSFGSQGLVLVFLMD